MIVLKTISEKQARLTIARMVGVPVPIHTIATGVHAIAGIGATKPRTGVRKRYTRPLSAVTTPIPTPVRDPTEKPSANNIRLCPR